LHDNPGGPYRTFHDHILIEMYSPAVLEHLTKVRMTNPSKDDIEETVKMIRMVLVEEGDVE